MLITCDYIQNFYPRYILKNRNDIGRCINLLSQKYFQVTIFITHFLYQYSYASVFIFDIHLRLNQFFFLMFSCLWINYGGSDVSSNNYINVEIVQTAFIKL